MERALIVTSTEKGVDTFKSLLAHNLIKNTDLATSAGEARRFFIEREYDLVIINTPLIDEFGHNLAKTVAENGITQVILIVKSEIYDSTASEVEHLGIFTLAKPISKGLFWSALKLASASHNKLKNLYRENDKLVKKLEDIRLINRAKCLLIENLKMSEGQAHRYIEKQAMDMRKTSYEIANNIIKTYEN